MCYAFCYFPRAQYHKMKGVTHWVKFLKLSTPETTTCHQISLTAWILDSLRYIDKEILHQTTSVLYANERRSVKKGELGWQVLSKACTGVRCILQYTSVMAAIVSWTFCLFIFSTFAAGGIWDLAGGFISFPHFELTEMVSLFLMQDIVTWNHYSRWVRFRLHLLAMAAWLKLLINSAWRQWVGFNA